MKIRQFLLILSIPFLFTSFAYGDIKKEDAVAQTLISFGESACYKTTGIWPLKKRIPITTEQAAQITSCILNRGASNTQSKYGSITDQLTAPCIKDLQYECSSSYKDITVDVTLAPLNLLVIIDQPGSYEFSGHGPMIAPIVLILPNIHGEIFVKAEGDALIYFQNSENIHCYGSRKFNCAAL